MATSSNVDSAEETPSYDERASRDEPVSHGDSDADEDSSSTLDRLETAARGIRAAFLAFVVVFALIPAVALWFGAAPFDSPPAGPYFAFVLAALVATAALIAGAVYDV